MFPLLIDRWGVPRIFAASQHDVGSNAARVRLFLYRGGMQREWASYGKGAEEVVRLYHAAR
mgnify:CR=1 FL=1